MRAFRVLAVLTLGVAVGAQAQLAVQQPTEKLLLLPLPVAPADSATSIATMDAARARLIQLARYKAMVIPKAKICEALQQSGFPCDGLMSDVQAGQLARALGINSYTTGQLQRGGGEIVARIRVISGASGFASSFTVRAATPAALGEAIAQRLNSVIRAAEYARNCNEQRSRNQLVRALAEARKAFTIEPNLAAANLCMATVFEVQHAPPDSQLAAFRRARQGDPGNSEAWSREAQVLMVKGDTTGAVDAFDSLLNYNPGDNNLRKALAQLLLQHKQYDRAQRLLKVAIDMGQADQQMRDMRKRACIEGGLYRCTLEILREEVTADSTKLADTTMLKLALANAQAAPDTQAMLWWAHAAVARYPTSAAWAKQLGGAFQMAGRVDSAVFFYRKALTQDPGDVSTGVLIAKTIVDAAVWDTVPAGACQRRNDTTCLRQLRTPFIAKVDPARQYLASGYASPDSGLRLAAAVVGLSGGSKLAQAGAYDPAYTWLDQLLNALNSRASADTAGPRHAIRRQGSFWFGLSSALSLGVPYQAMVKAKSCDQAKDISDRIQRSLQAMDLGGSIAPSVAIQMRSILMQYANQMPRVKQAFKCRNF
ncbi:MAG TPA: tetratricopeptide repeat protein [Gemmatimonadales bacterium]|nr:tetratricopeptide repeat protein [Gemmatimonadales bacterium]